MDPKPSRREEPSSRKRKAPSSSPSGTHADPDPEQQKAPSSSGTHPDPDPEIQKVCIVCSTDPETLVEGQSDCFHLYIVDLAANVSENVDDNRVFDPKSPTYRIGDDFPSDAMCALGSTLYMFDGFRPRDKPGRGKIPYMYKLPANVSTIENSWLERGMLTEIPSMHQAKSVPVAIVTPDKKKIVVFSSQISMYPFNINKATTYYTDFEIFCPHGECGGSWEKLAGIPARMRSSSYLISSYTFMNENILVLQTDKHMMFTVDLRRRDQVWKRLPQESPEAPLLIDDWDYFILLEGDLHLTTSFVYYNEEYEKGLCFSYPEVFSVYPNYIPNGRRITLLHCDASRCTFCIIQTDIGNIDGEYPYPHPYPHLTVNLYTLDISEFKKAKEKLMRGRYNTVHNKHPLPGTCIKSFKFSMIKEPLPMCFFSTMLFPIWS